MADWKERRSHASDLDILREANERSRSRSSRTLLDILRNKRIEQETIRGRERLTKRLERSDEKAE
jgi:hypothetical protein